MSVPNVDRLKEDLENLFKHYENAIADVNHEIDNVLSFNEADKMYLIGKRNAYDNIKNQLEDLLNDYFL